MNADESNAIVIPNNNYFANREGHAPKFIILHATAGGTSAQAIAQYFQSTQGTGNPVSSHYIIGVDGVVVQAVSENDGAYGNGIITAGHDPWWDVSVNPNNITISIEHCKPSIDNSDALTDAQKQASFKLIEHICERHNIPKRRADVNGGITGHYSIDPVNRSQCPGPYPWQELFDYLTGGEDMPTTLQISQCSDYFDEVTKDQRWRCKKNQCDIALGILAFYRTYGQSGLNGLSWLGLPLTNELSVPAFPGVAYQRFERGCVIFDPQRHVDNPPGVTGPIYTLHIDNGVGVDPRVPQQQAIIADLKTQLAQKSGIPQPLHDALIQLKTQLASFS